ncbi:MAG: ROK family protein [Opitutaceae bacterium]
MKALGIDIGGSAMKGAPVDTRTGRLLAPPHRIPIHRDLPPKEGAKVVAAIAEHFSWSGPIGVGFPGAIEGGHIRTSANLHPGFVDVDGSRLFGKASGCPVALINDAAAAGRAEMKFGAGRGFDGKTLLLTLGTGVGTCLAQDGVVIPLELGHFPWKNGEGAEKYVASSVKDRERLSWKVWGGRLNAYVLELERLLWPERIIMGGGVSTEHARFFRFIRCRARLMPARFRNEAGIVGAALRGAQAG